MSTQNANNVNITGGMVAGMNLPHTVNKIASANVRNSHDAEVGPINNSNYVLAKTITLTNGLIGQQRFLVDIKITNASYIGYAILRKNGVDIGTEQSTSSGTYVTKSQDITQTWNPGDICELWLKCANTFIRAQNFRIAYDDSPTTTVASTNS